MSTRARQSGFTLVELMMVIVIIAILVAIALPSYNNQIKRSKRTAGQAQMMLIANKQAEYLLTSRAYLAKAAMGSGSASFFL